ncbi:hypothetical protein K432DRAFT_423576 [Lepidopterella palustris CBS 459.81]|uniref:DUF6536 domain-containing protein n=1 Tax=Lepidopterella palustris CBS 459.81 TaxID=1314670 RepID=A0A8E2EFU0_9PEZI|nr:hypothetical protein K432DRAFT_423576 [Lepidopterella palustris CBS 459.81]
MASHSWSYPLPQNSPQFWTTYQPFSGINTSAASNVPFDRETGFSRTPQTSLPDPQVSTAIPPYKQRSFRQKYFSGVKINLRIYLLIAISILIANISWFLWAKSKYNIHDNQGTIQRGNCAEAKKLDRWLHLLINVLSSALLAGSNVFMQVCSSPTRDDIDGAHRRHRWLHVGVLSFKNLMHVGGVKVFVCVILAISSIPFHLLYNSLVFKVLAIYPYDWLLITSDMASGAPWKPTMESHYLNQSTYEALQRMAASYESVSNYDCIKTYTDAFQSSRRNVFIVTSDTSNPDPIPEWGPCDADVMNCVFFACAFGEAGYCDPETLLANADSWRFRGHPVDHCLSEKTDERCSIRYNYSIIIPVIFFNALKILVMVLVLLRFDTAKVLVTPGDAVMSFAAQEDWTTQGRCLLSKKDLTCRSDRSSPKQYRNPGRWHRAVSPWRWAFFVLLLVLSISLASALLGWGISEQKSKGFDTSLSGLWNLGIGTLTSRSLITDNAGFSPAGLAIWANLPQVFLAILFLAYNNILVSLFLSQDWNAFALKGRTLMVSSPAGIQRGMWMLGSPWGYGIVMLVIHIFLHWLVSQSLFIVETETIYGGESPIALLEANIPNIWGYTPTKTYGSGSATLGYSPIAGILALVCGVVLLAGAMVLGFRKFDEGGPPVASTCSEAISAACHLNPHDRNDDLRYKELRWGDVGLYQEAYGSERLLHGSETGTSMGGMYDGQGVRHCSFVSAEEWERRQLRSPRSGIPYA